MLAKPGPSLYTQYGNSTTVLCDLFLLETLTSTHNACVFQLYSLSCVSLRQYRACVIDSLGLGINYVHLLILYCTYKPSRSCFLCHPYIPHSNLNIHLYHSAASNNCRNKLFLCTANMSSAYRRSRVPGLNC